MGLRIAVGVLALAVVTLSVLLFKQGDRLEAVERELHGFQDKLDAAGPMAALPAARAPAYVPPPSASRAEPNAPRPAPGTEDPTPAPIAAPRVPVTQAQIDHVESAVLSLLEADRPELREKLRAVVQEQQRSLEQQQREERRERWAARREARLLEVGKEIGLTADQQESILHIMLATRDQIADMRQSAQTPEAINELRTKARAIRDQSEAQIRELMSPQQFEKYNARFGDDDDDDRRPPRPN